MELSSETNRVVVDKIKAIIRTLDREERGLVRDIFYEYAKTGDSSKLQDVYRTVYESRRPPIDEFVYSNQFLGLPKGSIYPKIMDVLVAADDPSIREVYLCCGKGSGKSTVASIGMARGVHDLLCFHDPAAYFQLLPGEEIAVVNMSISSDQAENVLFSKFFNLVNNATCFHDGHGNAFFKTKKRHILFPKGVHVLSGHSGYQAYFGYNVYVGCMDEISWFKDTRDHSVSAEVFQGILSAAKTRFDGYYKIYGVSSPQAQDDFLFQKVAAAKRYGQLIVEGEDQDLGIG